jgi:tetratricopeptide (TPR) repeat protein
MNPIQKRLLGLGAAVMLAMLIFPPWSKITHRAVLGINQSTMQTETKEFAGYSPLFEPPKTRSLDNPLVLMPGQYYESVEIDFDLFLLQWLTAAFLTAAGSLYFKGSDKKSLQEWWASVITPKTSRPATDSPVLRQAPPVSETQVPTNVASAKASETTPRSQLSPWKRADKAFGFGFFVGAVSAYQGNRNNPDLSSSGRMLLAGIVGVVVGLLSYLAAVGYYARKAAPKVADEASTSKTQKTKYGLVTAGIIALFIMWLIGKNQETKTAQETPNSSAASQVEKPNNAANAEAQAAREGVGRQQQAQPNHQAALSLEQLQAVKAKAEAGDAKAQFLLGVSYFVGEDVPQNYEAVKWLNKAAEKGFVEAQVELGVAYYNGFGVKQNYAEAEKWFRKAAEQDYDKAQFNLASMYLHGVGVPQNFAEACKWSYRAAQQGNVEAQGILGACYEAGWGVQPDQAEAYKWLSLSVAGGETNVVKGRDQLTVRLSPEQLAEGQRRAAAFVPYSSHIFENQIGMTNQ